MYKKLILLMAFMLIFPLVGAQNQDLGEFERGETINLIQTCICSSVNFTSVYSVTDELDINLISETEAEQNGNFFNITFVTNENFSLGTYIVSGFGVIDGEEVSFIYDFTLIPAENEIFFFNFDDNVVLIVFIIAFIIAVLLAVFGFNVISGSLLAFLGFAVGYNINWIIGLIIVLVGVVVIVKGGKKR